MPPVSSDAGPIENKELSKSELIDFLNDESDVKETIALPDDEETTGDDKKADKVVKSADSEKEDESEEKEIKLVDEEDEEEEPKFDENELEIIAPARRKDILKKYPNLFKEFPHLEKAYYRDQQYNELFSTPEEARETLQAAKQLEQHQSTLLKGNTQQILRAVKDSNPDSFAKIVDGYLTTLKDVDERAFYHVIGNLTKSTVAAMAQEAQRTQNEDLLTAARLFYQFMTGTTNFENPKPYGKQRPQEEIQQESELSRERQQFFVERFETVQGELQSKVDGVLKNTIDQNIDPRNSMTSYVKKVAVNEVMETVQKAIDSDPQFRKHLDRLWEKAADEKFSRNATDKIRSAYLSKAKTLLPAAIKKSRNEALRGLGKRVREENNEPDDNVRTKRESTSAPATLRGSNSRDNPSKGKRTLDFLNED